MRHAEHARCQHAHMWQKCRSFERNNRSETAGPCRVSRMTSFKAMKQEPPYYKYDSRVLAKSFTTIHNLQRRQFAMLHNGKDHRKKDPFVSSSKLRAENTDDGWTMICAAGFIECITGYKFYRYYYWNDLLVGGTRVVYSTGRTVRSTCTTSRTDEHNLLE